MNYTAENTLQEMQAEIALLAKEIEDMSETLRASPKSCAQDAAWEVRCRFDTACDEIRYFSSRKFCEKHNLFDKGCEWEEVSV